jgi:hypothetical protein
MSEVNRQHLRAFQRANESPWNKLAAKHSRTFGAKLSEPGLHALSLAQHLLDRPHLLRLKPKGQRQARKALDRFHFHLSPENLDKVNEAVGSLSPVDEALKPLDYADKLLSNLADPVQQLENNQAA